MVGNHVDKNPDTSTFVISLSKTASNLAILIYSIVPPRSCWPISLLSLYKANNLNCSDPL